MSFSALAPLWDVVAPPLRPSAEDIAEFGRHARGRVLVLGATQELLELAPEVRGVDVCEEMVARAGAQVSLGDWRALPLDGGSVDTVLGDGSLSAVGEAADRRQVLEEIQRVLRPGGRLVLRSYVRTADPRPARLGINALKLWLWGHSALPDGRVLLQQVWRAWRELPERVRGAYDEAAAGTVECYRVSASSYWVPTIQELATFVGSTGLREHSRHVSCSYELAGRCPIIAWEVPS